MKKTFKRGLACLLAVLMVALSMPFTALAASEFIGPTPQGSHDYLGVSGGIWWDEQNPPTSEPEYIGYNSDELNEWWNSPGTGGWGAAAGAPINLLDTETGAMYDDLYDEYKPFISVYTVDYSSNDAVLYGTTAKNALSDCKVLNPNDLHTGDKIAVTFEFGGYDALFSADLKLKFDTNYVKAGYWKSNRGKWSWVDSTTKGALGANGVVATSSDLLCYPGITSDGISLDPVTGEVACTVRSTNVGTGISAYVGKDVRTYGENGIVFITISLSVQQDCKLSDVIKPKTGDAGTIVAPYAPDALRVVRSELTNVDNTNRNVYAYLVGDGNPETQGNGTIYGLIAPPYYYVPEGTEPSGHEHTYGEPTYKWDGTSCTATAVCSTCEEGTKGHTVTETVTGALKGEATLPDCTTEGSATYTATFTNPLFTEQETKITTPANGHTFGDEYAHIPDSNPGQHAKKCSVCGALDTANAVKCDYKRVVTKEPTCVTEGEATYTCPVCHDSYTLPVDATGNHTNDYSNVSYSFNEDKSVCTATIGCSVCGGTAETVESTRVDVVADDDATCTTPGKTTYTAIFDDENLTYSETVDGEKAPHSYDYENAVYTWAEDFSTCSAVATCTVCGEAEDTATAKEITSEVTTEPGFDKEGTRTYTAVFDEPFKNATKTETIPAIPYYTITVTAENGTATANGEASAKVAVNGDVTLAAAPATEGLEFVGWSLNDKIVSTDETYTTKAIANADYVAIYAEAEEASEFTVVFVDQYGSVYSTQTVTSGTQVVPPADPSLVGFTFKGWSLTDEEIDALTSNTTIYANFERTVADDKFDVTVTGDCTIEGTEEKTLAVDYNTKVTVNAPEGAVNGTWKVDDAIVAYGTSYTFFVGSDITLTYEEDAAVTAEPTVAAVSVTKDASSYRVSFLATRSLADGYAYVNAGFVFGKNLEDADLNLDKVGETGTGTDSGVVKALYCSTDSEQFSLSYGISAATGTASARAFLAYVDTNGETQIIYGDIQSYRY